MRVLLIAYHFPPSPAVGAIRAGRIAASLVAAGHQVEVLSILENGYPAVSERDGIRVTRVGRVLEPRRMLVGLKRLLSRGRKPNPAAAAEAATAGASDPLEGWQPPTEVPAWRRYLGSLLWLPDDQQGWIPAVVAAGMKRIRNGVDIIYSTAPPFSAHVAAAILKKLSGRPLVAELRDPWVGNPWKPWYVRSRWTDTVDAWLEGFCMDAADRVVAVTAAAAREISERRGAPGSVVLVRNGIPALPAGEAAKPAAANSAERSIIYLGTLYHSRDPRPFLESVALLNRAGRLPPLRVEFIGNCSHYMGVDLARLCAGMGLSEVVRFVPQIPHAECQARIQNADLLLLLAQDQPSQVPQKLYEYLATGRPVIAFADADGETTEMLRHVGGHYLVTETSPDAVAEILASALDGGGEPADAAVLREWSAERQMQRLVSLVEEAAA